MHASHLREARAREARATTLISLGRHLSDPYLWPGAAATLKFTLGHLVGVIFSTQNPTNSKLDTFECHYQEAKLDAYDP